ncbi:probable myosin-binding protein 6 [Vigna radiata var. radiata]|uniref:Probable myosin-binding protein 6 n=1 Tax=Vigna radiata var. radiata TaxID=3916 RepID=A0A1S3UQ90_VIGRR|nr:probable myosin-binding protein 6 [Vigna radiata var. radiata]
MDFPPALNLLTQFGCGFVLLRSLSLVFNFLGVLLMLSFWFKVWRFSWNSKSAIRFLCTSGGAPQIRFCLDKVAWGVSKAKTAPLRKARPSRSSSSIRKRTNGSRERGNAGSEDGSEGKGENEKESGNEDEVLDVMTLKNFVKMERQKANAACADLEKERTAAASSAEEAMAMILRLQNEKSAVEIQATQFRRMAEQKLDYDQEVIESLQWTITQHEVQKCELEDQMEICREELRQFMRDEDIEQLEVEVSRDYMYDDEEEDGDRYDNSVVSSPETEPQTL